MEPREISDKLEKTFSSGITRSYEHRMENLRKLGKCMKAHEEELFEALFEDLGKSREESYATELGIVYSELRHTSRNLRKWMKPEKVSTSILHFPSSSYIYKDPIGKVLIMSPWNYPVQLTLVPLIGAIAAGCTALIKPSRYSENTSRILAMIIRDAFPESEIALVEGGREVNNELLEIKWDHIFFTGSPNVGRIVMMKAASTLTPTTLELGGKSPVIIDETADIPVAARRLSFAKFINAGQTCVAPDYVLIRRGRSNAFIDAFRSEIERMYPDSISSDTFPDIINEKHFERLSNLLDESKIIYGGERDRDRRRITPTILYPVDKTDAIMQEEIFGPVLPILEYEDLDEAIEYVNSRPHPLAFYIYSENRANIDKLIASCRFGGGCVNDSLMHLVSHSLPFGGVGNSGTGSYHGKKTFDTFTHEKSILKHSTKLDVTLRNPPMKGKEKLFRALLK